MDALALVVPNAVATAVGLLTVLVTLRLRGTRDVHQSQIDTEER